VLRRLPRQLSRGGPQRRCDAGGDFIDVRRQRDLLVRRVRRTGSASQACAVPPRSARVRMLIVVDFERRFRSLDDFPHNVAAISMGFELRRSP